ncbi:hypothetical protein C7Y47_06380 [Lysinibacillus sphaericus]|uniref:Uncharacterized protein n=1 Tax=Lysinibacillus sphaericus TaxID=1421 RepID=A0A544UPY2_LYSSH|nr:hypothetical protein [Lysinibacillus sp. SDF0037]TQR35910.1 hypothetical protein C7Y47_06380 [Lysinibacillus sp. SDF0037]
MWDYSLRLGPYKQAPQLRADKLQRRICIIGEIENTVLSKDNAVRLIVQQQTNDTSFFSLYYVVQRNERRANHLMYGGINPEVG